MSWHITTGRVERFCKHYHGQKFHALLCDPPYNLAFMGKEWDKGGIAFKPETWAALAEHLLPGAFGMTFAGSRGWHRVACAIEDAGLRLHPTIFCWAFGSGFPKATRVGKLGREPEPDKGTVDPSEWAKLLPEIRAKADEERERVRDEMRRSDPFAATWAGHRYGLQALKPAVEPIIVFQKPYEGKPVDSIVKHGAGALNIEAGRTTLAGMEEHKTLGKSGLGKHGVYGASTVEQIEGKDLVRYDSSGRWPANFALQHHPDCRRVGSKKVKNPSGSISGNEPSIPAKNVYGKYGRHSFARHADANGLETVESWNCAPDCPIRKLDEQSGDSKSTQGTPRASTKPGDGYGMTKTGREHADAGGASRFFLNSDWNAEVEEGIFGTDPVNYRAKAPGKERNAGLEAMPETVWSDGREKKADYPKQRGKTPRRNHHPTVKPIKLCRWLARLLLPPEQYAPRRILVPFAGSGSEMIACALEGWDVLGVEMMPEYVEIAKARLAYWLGRERQGTLWRQDT